MSEEIVDPKPELEKKCHPSCLKEFAAYEACAERIKGDSTGEKHCSPQYFQYLKCVDKCVAPKLFSSLK